MSSGEEIVTEVLRRINEHYNPEDPTHWTRYEVLDALNDGLFEFNLMTYELTALAYLTVNSTYNIYSAPSTIVAPFTVYADDKALMSQSLEDLDKECQWEQSDQVARVPSVWCPLGLSHILIHKRPTWISSVGINGLEMPTLITDDDTRVKLREDYIPAIIEFALNRLLFKEGGAEFEQANNEYQRFMEVAQSVAGENLLEGSPLYKAGETE